jgi:hypothetical protein
MGSVPIEGAEDVQQGPEGRYGEIARRITSATGLVPTVKLPGPGAHTWRFTDGQGREVTVLLKYTSWDPEQGRWFSGVGEHNLQAIAQGSGFLCIGLMDSHGERLEGVLCVSGATALSWLENDMLGRSKARNGHIETKFNICLVGGHYLLANLDGPRIGQFIDAFHLLTA